MKRQRCWQRGFIGQVPAVGMDQCETIEELAHYWLDFVHSMDNGRHLLPEYLRRVADIQRQSGAR